MTDKEAETQVNLYGGVFNDSDDENENVADPVNDAIVRQFQDKFKGDIKHLKEYLSNPDFITGKNDPSTNIVDLYSQSFGVSNTFCIPDDKISKMFKYIELCRRSKSKMMMYEKQMQYSGIMLDFDICQKGPTSEITEDMFRSITRVTMKLLIKYIDMINPSRAHPDKAFKKHFVFIRKPSVKFNTEKKYYKDGFHLLIPGIQITREVKRFLIEKIKEEKIYNDIFIYIETADMGESNSNYSYLDFVDVNSAHVPVFFLGSHSKPGSDPYVLDFVSTAGCMLDRLDSDDHVENLQMADCKEFNAKDDKSPIVLAHEFSLNWEVGSKSSVKNDRDVSIIRKEHYEIKEQYANQIQTFKNNMVEEDDSVENAFGELSILHIHDPDTQYISDLLNTLKPSRYTDFGQWFKVLCVLAHTNKSYKSLAETFSMKSPDKFNRIDFEHHWDSASTGKANRLNIGSLHFWAKLDNPLKYEEVRQRSIFTIVFKKVYDTQLEGSLQHYDIARILESSLRHKYAYDACDGGAWYEFILEEDPHKAGEIYKWRRCNKAPNSIKKYMSDVLPIMFDKVFSKIDATLESLKGDDLHKYHKMIQTNLKASCRKLRDNGFKNGVANECEQVFEKHNFSNTLNTVQDVLGVGNGLIKLGTDVHFITGYHNYSISQFTPVDYIPFNPYNPITKNC